MLPRDTYIRPKSRVFTLDFLEQIESLFTVTQVAHYVKLAITDKQIKQPKRNSLMNVKQKP